MYGNDFRYSPGLPNLWTNPGTNNKPLNNMEFGISAYNQLRTTAQVQMVIAQKQLDEILKRVENNFNEDHKIRRDNLKRGIDELEKSVEMYRKVAQNDYIISAMLPFKDEIYLLLARSYVCLGNLCSILAVPDEAFSYYSRALNYNDDYVVENIDTIVRNIEQALNFARAIMINKEFLSKLSASVIKALNKSSYLNLDSQPLSIKNLELKKQQLHLYEILVKLCDISANNVEKQHYINDYSVKKVEYDKDKKLLDIDHLCESATQYYISENYVDAVVALQSAFNLLDTIDDKDRAAAINCLFGLVCVQEEDYASAELYLQKAFTLAKEINNTIVLIDAAFFLGKIYFISQNNFIAKEKFMEVVCAPIVVSEGLWGAATYFLVCILINENNINEAIRLVKPLIGYAADSRDIDGLRAVLHLCVDIYYKLNDYISAATYLKVINGQGRNNDEILNIAKLFIKYENLQPQLEFVSNSINTSEKQLNHLPQKNMIIPHSKKDKSFNWSKYKTLPKAKAIQAPILINKPRQINVKQPPLTEQQLTQVNVDGVITSTSSISTITLLPPQFSPNIVKVKESSAAVKNTEKLQKSKFMQKTKLNKLIEIKNDQKHISEIPQWRIKLQKLGRLIDIDKSNNLVVILDKNTQEILSFQENKQNRHMEPRLSITMGEGGKGFKSLKYNLIKIGDLEFKKYEMKKPNVADRIIFIKLGNYLLPYGELKNKDYTRVRKYTWFDDMFLQAQEILKVCS
ncbi:MAG: tetratricopeptide repeat protein [Burkholderiales bacterium]|nr:tetratricopeptide repeat protein [Burkholderiales bacterium]